MDAANWVVLVVGILGGGGGLWSYLASRRKTRAEATKIIQEAAGGLVISMQQQIDRMEKRIQQLEEACEQFEEVFTGAHKLHDQVVSLHADPVYTPPERRHDHREREP